MLAVYDGRECRGHVLSRGWLGFDAGHAQGAVRQRARCRRGEEVPPEIEIIVAKHGTITVTDNANGIATETIKAILDYSVRGRPPRRYRSGS